MSVRPSSAVPFSIHVTLRLLFLRLCAGILGRIDELAWLELGSEQASDLLLLLIISKLLRWCLAVDSIAAADILSTINTT